MSKTLIPLNIIEFIRHPDALNEQRFSETQLVIVKSLYGLPLTERELEIYRRGTGREKYEAKEHREMTEIAGRRGGKDLIASAIMCYEAFRDHQLPPGEVGYVMLLATTLDQAQIAFRYIRNYIGRSKALSDRVRKITEDEIILENNTVIGCYACTYDRVRGRTIVAAIADEIGFWPEQDSANPAEEVLAALRPGMITVRNAKLIKISTPYRKSGVLWDEYSRRNELDFPVWQVSTFEMNPTITPESVEPERQLSEQKFLREYFAQFTDSIETWIPSEFLDLSIVRGRRELPPVVGVNYVAALDAAFRGDDFALLVAHQGPEQSVVIDLVTTWTGTPKAPLAFESVLNQVKEILERYDINWVTGDEYQSDPIEQYFLKLGIKFNRFNFTAKTRGQLFSGLKYLLVEQKIELLDNPQLLQQLRSLHEENSKRGHFDVQSSYGKDDLAVALALVVQQVRGQTSLLPFESMPIDTRPSNASLGQIPGQCRKESVCLNFPDCLEAGYCLGFRPDSSLIQIDGWVHRITMK